MMSSWLRNIQGQLSELASEVLNEATEEVNDPESELQVAKKKLLEAEKELNAERDIVQRLKKKVENLEEELYAKNLELDTVNAKYIGVIESRDTQIRALQEELERKRHSTHLESVSDEDDDGVFPGNSARIARMRDEIDQLRKEAAHWKRLVNEQSEKSDTLRIVELERLLAEQKSKFENEVATLIHAHNETIAELKSLNVEDRNVNEKPESPSCYNEKFISEIEAYKEQISLLTEERDVLLTKISMVHEENAMQEDQIDKLTFEVVDEVLNERLNELQQQREHLQKQFDMAQEEVITKNGSEELHNLIDMQRENFEHKITVENKRSRAQIEELQKEVKELQLLNSREEGSNEELKMAVTIEELNKEIETWRKRVEVSENSSKEQQATMNRELEKLRRENAELTAAYNDLNEDFENHKAEHGSVVTSNRDLTARIDALKANLIEYEERYEMCKNENAETVQQLEKLSNDFERLRLSFENSKTKSASDAVDEVERLRTELDASKDDREKLRADVERFRSAIGAIDTELNRLRESNDKLVQDNKAMGASLDKFTEIRDMLESSDAELKNLREKFFQLQNEHELKERQWREQLLELSEALDDAKRRLEDCQRETAMRQSRSDIALSADIVELKTDEGKATTSSEGTVDSNSGWEKMVDWDATAPANGSSISTSGPNNSTIMNELREALAAVTEKTEECEELRKQKQELDKELGLRQTCIDELMVQMNVLQSQQHVHTETFSQLRGWANELERDKLELERNLVYTKEKLNEVQKQLDSAKEEESRRINYVDSVQKTVEDYEQKIKDLNAAHEEALRAANAEHKHVLEEMENELKKAQDEINRLQQQNKALEEKFNSMAETVENVKSSHMDSELQEAIQRQNELEKVNCELQYKFNEASLQLTKSEQLRTELVALVEQKHAESVDYHALLKAALTDKERQSTIFASNIDRLSVVEQELKNCMEARDKALKECERLRDHLLTIEEASNMEALAGEKREVELRQRIRMLERKVEESAESVIESASTYQREIAELIKELDLMKAEKVSIVDRLREREETLADTKLALSNLQNVLRDIGVDHEAQILQYENATAELKKNIESLNLEIVQLKQTQDDTESEKRILEDSTVRLKEDIARKNAMIEELEASLDEHVQVAETSVSSYTIDDQVLRQLFLSYFTADKDKQPEIAVLLASVLGYSQEDVAKINAATHSSSKGWFGFGGSRLPQQNISLAEQFVRFLEKESLTTPHVLPVQESEEKETIRSSSVPLNCSRPSSATDLHSILNT
uniref:GRIP domain-containing protein n=1 Tax=Setaria digitata TaxID=48799 RepID=A0A915PRB0_9BILA